VIWVTAAYFRVEYQDPENNSRALI
jgi:hypothetical protein